MHPPHPSPRCTSSPHRSFSSTTTGSADQETQRPRKMMRKMADKLGHITSPRPASAAGANNPPSSHSAAPPSGALPALNLQQQQLQQSAAQVLHSPSPSLSSTQSTALSSAGPRPSVSTERTSVSEWKGSSNNPAAEKQAEQMDVDSPAEPAVPLQVRRQTGTYRLSDFIIHRTLGTGSFGRVHLGMPLPLRLE